MFKILTYTGKKERERERKKRVVSTLGNFIAPAREFKLQLTVENMSWFIFRAWTPPIDQSVRKHLHRKVWNRVGCFFHTPTLDCSLQNNTDTDIYNDIQGLMLLITMTKAHVNHFGLVPFLRQSDFHFVSSKKLSGFNFETCYWVYLCG